MQLSQIQKRIGTMRELLDVVGAMRSLAGMHLQESQQALPGIRRYAEVMADAIGSALYLIADHESTPSDRSRRALLLFTAEHGFVAGHNQSLFDAAVAVRRSDDIVFALGSRGTALLREQGWSLAWTAPMATRTASAAQTAQNTSTELYRRIAGGEFARVELIFARFRQSGSNTIEHRRLLPVDLAPLAQRAIRHGPLVNLQPAGLLEDLLQDYVFALLMEATIEALASENAARFAAMETAHHNVTEKLEQLDQAERSERQSEITTELIDLVTGTQALGVSVR